LLIHINPVIQKKLPASLQPSKPDSLKQIAGFHYHATEYSGGETRVGGKSRPYFRVVNKRKILLLLLEWRWEETWSLYCCSTVPPQVVLPLGGVTSMKIL